LYAGETEIKLFCGARERIPIYGIFPELDLFGLDVRLANDAAIFVMLFAKISAELRSARPYRSDPG
jgi:hypothetical protein